MWSRRPSLSRLRARAARNPRIVRERRNAGNAVQALAVERERKVSRQKDSYGGSEEKEREKSRRWREGGDEHIGKAKNSLATRGIMRNPVNAPVSGHHSTASLTLGSIGMQWFSRSWSHPAKSIRSNVSSIETCDEIERHCSTGAGVNETRWLPSKIHRVADVDQFLSNAICIQLARTDSGVNPAPSSCLTTTARYYWFSDSSFRASGTIPCSFLVDKNFEAINNSCRNWKFLD